MLNMRYRNQTNPWPGFVDLFSNLVIILIFLLIVFVFLWTTTSVFNKSTGARVVAELKETNATQAEQSHQMTMDEEEAKRLLILARNELENLEKNNIALTNELNEMDLSIDDLITAYENKVNDLQAQGIEMQAMLNSLTQQLNQATLDKELASEQEQERTAKLEQERAALQEQMEIQYLELSAIKKFNMLKCHLG